MSEEGENSYPAAERWLNYARQDLETAEAIFENKELPPRNACFHAHQAAEKAIKSVLTAKEIPFPKTHDLIALTGLIPEGLPGIGEEALLDLSQWAVESKYPSDQPEASRPEAEIALHEAEAVLGSAERVVETDIAADEQAPE